MKKLNYTLGLIVFFAFFAASCSENDDSLMDDPGSGNFSVSISGDENFLFTGEAAFIHATVSGGETSASGTTLTINMFGAENEENAVVVTLLKKDLKLFGVGSYDFIEDPDDEEVMFSVSLYSETTSATYVITSGSIMLKTVRNNMVEGSLEANLTNFNGKNISIAGTFKATGITQTF